ncbi:S-adenosyl-L-methionine-dependent methyltransferase [Triangularia setosa]|uniref:S-adenosyl-L-methionine-dependent methyltransferase n=1 Tax=Triangularia setosa TaxID=2587417 RepID=A0AAN6W4V1_9PEZI|nr:S-adenosyl-L-methionine-dependent methyltransferase [Podospora setosa]
MVYCMARESQAKHRGAEQHRADPVRHPPGSSLLGDNLATAVIEKIDYNFEKLQVGSLTAAVVGLRSALLDKWTSGFLSRHSYATVAHLACGFNTRSHWISWSDGVRWIDIDLRNAVQFWKSLMPDPLNANNYTFLAGSALDRTLIESPPNDRSIIVVIEGLVPYFTTAEEKQ